MAKGIENKVAKVGRFFSGDALLNRFLEKQLLFVFYIFLCVCLFITWSLYVESALVQVERNEKVLEELEIHYHQKSLELVGLNNRSKVESLLKQHNSTLHPPVEPAQRVELE